MERRTIFEDNRMIVEVITGPGGWPMIRIEAKAEHGATVDIQPVTGALNHHQSRCDLVIDLGSNNFLYHEEGLLNPRVVSKDFLRK